MAIDVNNGISNNKSQALSFDSNGGVSAIKTGGVIDFSGALRGPNTNDTRLAQAINAEYGKGASVYTVV